MGRSKITPQLFAVFAATLSLVCSGFHFGWSSPSLPKLLADDSDIAITPNESSWIASIFTFGCTFGPLIGALLVNRIGRKSSLLLTTIPYLISAILIGVAQSYWWFLGARFIAGLGTGMAYGIVPMYVGEIADDKIRGALGVMIGLMSNVGILLSYSVGPWVSRAALACVGGAMSLAFGLTFIWIPESPYYWIIKDKHERAEKSLQWLRGTRVVSEELKKIQESVQSDKENTGTMKELLLIPGNRKALIIVLGLTLAQQFSGIGALLAYVSLIFEASGSTLDPSISVIIFGSVQLISGSLSIFTVDLAGRRILLLLSAGGVIVFLGGEALYFQLQAMGTDVSGISWLPVTAILGFIIFHAFGLNCLPYVVLSEIFPYNVKALANMVCAIGGSLSGMAVTKLYQDVADGFGIHVSFWGFMGLTVFSLIFIYFILPETKQRSLKSIQDELHKTTDSTVALEKSFTA